MENFKLEHISGQWVIFIVSSKVSLKTVILQNGNKVTSVPLVKELHRT
jgi:hypothetical protein